MPELPEVETIRRGLLPVLKDQCLKTVVARRDALRFPLPHRFADRLQGRRVRDVRRRGKYLLVELDGGLAWLIHLGMSGRLSVQTNAEAPLNGHDHVLTTLGSGIQLRFNDPRRFGIMDLVDGDAVGSHKLLRDLGPEPLDEAFDALSFALRLNGRQTSIKAALTDQRVVAGIGNIYACEALYWADMSPRRRAGSVRGQRAAKLVASLQRVLQEAIAAGGSSLRDYRRTNGELGYFQARFAVYDREGRACPRCNGACGVRRIVQAGRSTFYCARRQR